MHNLTNCFIANWDTPANVHTLITTRNGGFSTGDYASFNLATHVGDDNSLVLKNRQLLQQTLPSTPIWLNQTHSNNILNINAKCDGDNKNVLNNEFDAIIITKPNIVGVVMTADCIPILITNKHGSFVVAIHAGWKGLYNNIISNTINKLGEPMDNILVYIGPTICKEHFEVGTELYQSFIELDINYKTQFKQKNNSKYLCNLVGIAEMQLLKLRVTSLNITKSNLCTYCNNNEFYSYRKDGVTGRIASLIWFE